MECQQNHATNQQYPRLHQSQSEPPKLNRSRSEPPGQQQQVTAAVHQFRYFREKYPNCLLIIRFSDYRYEAFYEDALICSKVLGFEVEERHKFGSSFSVVGLPINQLESWSRRLVKAGYGVALMEDRWVRVLTPGSSCN